MLIKDERTEEQKQTHRYAVVGRDTCLSGWGEAKGGYSRAAWACESYSEALKVEKWVRSRGDMKFVSVVFLPKYRAPRGTVHLHIYVAGQDHPALQAA